MTRRAQTRQRSADHVERVALQLFLEQGYDATTVDDVAAAAGVSRASFFRYFQSKEGVVFARAQRDCDRLIETLRRYPTVRTDRAALVAALTEYVDVMREEREALAASMRLVAQHKGLAGCALMIKEEWTRAVARELSTGADVDLEARVLAGSVLNALQLVVEAYVVSGPDADAAPILRAALLTEMPQSEDGARAGDRPQA